MKKLFAAIMAFCLLSINAMPVLAECSCMKDVPCNYWAKSEISNVVANKIMCVDSKGNFNPEKSMSRIDFVQSLLKLLSNDNLDVNIQNCFTDVNKSCPAYSDILRSQQLGLVYGYPDRTFKANKTLLRSETTSIISHITKDKYTDLSILNQFKDRQSIPAWAVNAYAKTINYGIYVNYPDGKVLNPNRELTRAEAAVLLTRLQERLHLVKSQYKNEKLLRTEHLNVSKKAPVDTVAITNLRKIINANNILEVSYTDRFWTKKAQTGDIVNFIVEQNVYTKEGTLILPANSKFVAEVTEIIKPKKLNKNARVKFNFRQLILPDGRAINIVATPYTKDGYLKEGPWMTAGKLLGYTVGVGAIGAGAGVGFAFIPAKAAIGTGLAIGIPVGCSVGLITGLLTPGLHYRAKAGEDILILLNEDTAVPVK